MYGASGFTCPYAVAVRPGETFLLNHTPHQSAQNACSCGVSVIFGGSSGITGGFFTPFGRSGTVLRRPDACAGRVLVVAAAGLFPTTPARAAATNTGETALSSVVP